MKTRKKFMDGQMTPEELHMEMGLPPGARCSLCGRPPLVKYLSYAEEAEMLKRDPRLAICRQYDPQTYAAMLHKTRKGERYIKLSMAFACKQCTPEADKAAAKHPDWVVVIIDRGPGVDKIVTGPGT